MNLFFLRMTLLMRSLAARFLRALYGRKYFLLPPVAILGLFAWWISSPLHLIRAVAPFLPFSLEVKQGAEWSSYSSLRLKGIALGEFARIESMELDWEWREFLLHGKIRSLKLEAPQIQTANLAKAFPKSASPEKKSDLMQLSIERIEIKRGYLFLENIAPGVNLNIPLGRVSPLIVENFQIGNPESKAAQTLQHLISSDFILYSPVDATSPVLSFEAFEIDFTFQELAQNRIQKLRIKKPTIYIGPDLFWYLEKFQANQKTDPSTPWVIQRLEIESAGITINGFGNPGLKIPLFISKNIENVSTDQFGEIFKRNQFEVVKGDQFYPSYGLKINQFDGRIEFGLPVTEENVINQVISLKAETIEWKKLLVTEPWISVTFDSRGIFGKIGGKAYGGYLSGDCSIYFKPGFPWTASLHGKGLQVKEPFEKLAEDHFRMTGMMNIEVRAAAKSTVFEKSTAKIWLTGGGTMVIPAIDEVLQKLPESWSSLKKQMATIGLEAFKTFDYRSGTFDLTYDPVKSQAVMELIGKQGRRRFQVDWTQE